MSVAVRSQLELEIEHIDEILDANMTFPARWYSDPDVYAFEREHIFSRSWQLVGTIDQVAEPGSVMIGNVAHTPIVVTRDLDGELHGFINVCRHRAYPVAKENGCRKMLQCQYHAWTYELDGRLRKAPGSDRSDALNPDEFGLLPVSVDTWDRFVFVNPDPEAGTMAESYPEFATLAKERGLCFDDYVFYADYEYDVPSNWKVWAENATECYHCATIHTHSFADAFDVSKAGYEYVNTGRLLGQFTRFNAKAQTFKGAAETTTEDFRFIFMYPSTFFAQDDLVAFPGVITPTGPETCSFRASMYVRKGAGEAEVAAWAEMYNQTLLEDAEAVRLQQPGLSSGMVPHGRLMPSRESAILSFHRLVVDSMREGLRS